MTAESIQQTCTVCSNSFRDKKKRTKCGSCRQNIPCPKCDGTMVRTATTCHKCRPSQEMENSPTWRGGRTYHKKGYVMCRVRTDAGIKCIFEHVLVMEEMLGRRLLPGENVHHKNGVRDDNRPENLELWVRPQPIGIRSEDAVEWAKEILRRYDNGDDYLP